MNAEKCQTCGERMLSSWRRPGYVFCPNGHGSHYSKEADEAYDRYFWETLHDPPGMSP